MLLMLVPPTMTMCSCSPILCPLCRQINTCCSVSVQACCVTFRALVRLRCLPGPAWRGAYKAQVQTLLASARQECLASREAHSPKSLSAALADPASSLVEGVADQISGREEGVQPELPQPPCEPPVPGSHACGGLPVSEEQTHLLQLALAWVSRSRRRHRGQQAPD